MVILLHCGIDIGTCVYSLYYGSTEVIIGAMSRIWDY